MGRSKNESLWRAQQHVSLLHSSQHALCTLCATWQICPLQHAPHRRALLTLGPCVQVLQGKVPAVRRLPEVFTAAPHELGHNQILVAQVLCPAAHVWHKSAAQLGVGSITNGNDILVKSLLSNPESRLKSKAHLKRQAPNWSTGMPSRFCMRSATPPIVSVALIAMTKGTPNAVKERGVCIAGSICWHESGNEQ